MGSSLVKSFCCHRGRCFCCFVVVVVSIVVVVVMSLIVDGWDIVVVLFVEVWIANVGAISDGGTSNRCNRSWAAVEWAAA